MEPGLTLARAGLPVHAGKLEAIKISSVVLLSKESVEKYATVREQAKRESEARMLTRVDRELAQSRNRKLKELLSTMSVEEIDALLSKK